MRCLLVRATLAGLILLTPASAAQAQTPDWRHVPALGIGYAGTLPRALLGGGAHYTTPALGGFGLYGAVKVTHENYRDEQFLPNVTARQAETEFGDEFVREREHWFAANLALVRTITAELAVYAGAGHAKQTVYREYLDPNFERGVLGGYRVEDDEDSGTRVNITGGAIFRAGRRAAFLFGVETAPRGMSVGASILLR